jgi:acyl dehydratase
MSVYTLICASKYSYVKPTGAAGQGKEEQMSERYLEDFAAGQAFGSGRLRVDADRIKSFAREFDPQAFHLDETSARNTIFQGLAASGWHTAARRRAHAISA